jgi:hypothetical protein
MILDEKEIRRAEAYCITHFQSHLTTIKPPPKNMWTLRRGFGASYQLVSARTLKEKAGKAVKPGIVSNVVNLKCMYVKSLSHYTE